MAGLDHALVDVSHRQVAVEINGAHAGHILNGGCPLDLDLKEFPVGMCTRTLFAKADGVVKFGKRRDRKLVDILPPA